MAAFPPETSFVAAPGKSNADVEDLFEAWLEATKQLPGGAREQIVTLDANGKIAPTRCFNRVDTFGGSAADDLVGIDLTNMPTTAGNSHGVLWLRIADSSRKVTIKHNAGSTSEVFLADTTDFLMGSTGTRLCLVYTGTQWLEYGRWYGSDKAAFRNFLELASGATMGEASLEDADAGTITENDSIITPYRLKRYRPKSSDELTIGLGVKDDFNHGLGSVPSQFWGVLVCKTAQLGWVTDNRIQVDQANIAVWADATKVGFVCNDDPFTITNWTTGASGSLTHANWRIVLYAVK
jgi:hypothetical protein